MPFLVITGTERKEFETMRDALAYRTSGSRVCEIDAFGNVVPLTDDQIQEFLDKEPVAKPAEPKPEPEKPVNVTVTVQQPKDQQPVQQPAPVQKKDSGAVQIAKLLIYLMMIIAIIGFAVWILKPFFVDLQSIMDVSKMTG